VHTSTPDFFYVLSSPSVPFQLLSLGLISQKRVLYGR
jgi:hypothetical protein